MEAGVEEEEEGAGAATPTRGRANVALVASSHSRSCWSTLLLIFVSLMAGVALCYGLVVFSGGRVVYEATSDRCGRFCCCAVAVMLSCGAAVFR